jgi:chromosome segregation ATPase
MSLLEKFWDLLPEKRDKVEVRLSKVDEFFREENSGKISRTEEKAEKLKSQTEKLRDGLKDNLDDIKDYSDVEDLDVVEDVAESFYRSRKRLLEDFDPSEEIEEHFQDLNEMIEDFNDVSRKQGAVMKRVERNSGQLSGFLEKIIDHRDRISDFLDSEFRILERHRKIRGLSTGIIETENDIQDLEEQLQEKTTEDLEKELEETRESIEELKESDEWERYKELQDEISVLEERIEDRLRELRRDASKLDRGVRKLTYEIRNSDTGFKGDLEKLEKLSDREVRSLEDPGPELEEAEQKLRDEEILDDRQMEKFSEGVKKLSDFQERLAEVRELEAQKEELEEELENLEVEDEIQELSEEKKSLEKSIEEVENEREEIKSEIQSLEEEKQEMKTELEAEMNDFFRFEVEIVEEDRE